MDTCILYLLLLLQGALPSYISSFEDSQLLWAALPALPLAGSTILGNLFTSLYNTFLDCITIVSKL